ncbi:uncharacterized protein METZ01_LOCUS497462, partial [marine metagenome]
MAYSSTNTITAADYNSFVSTVNGVIGVGSGTKGYNQTALSSVSATDQITAAHWTGLLTAVTNAATHQGTSVTIQAEVILVIRHQAILYTLLTVHKQLV